MNPDVTITYKGKPLFQRITFPTPHQYQVKIEEYSCFFYIAKGTYQMIESHGSIQLDEKEALLKKCGNYISKYVASPRTNEVEAIAIYFHLDTIREIYNSLSIDILTPQQKTSVPRKMITQELIEKYISNLKVYFDNPELIDDDLALHKLKELVMILLKTEHYKDVFQFFSYLFNPTRLDFTQVVENNIFNPIAVRELAFLCHLSLSNFKRKFKQYYNESPAKYIKMRRLEKAAQMLILTSDLISEIAYYCGFQDPTTFSSSFQGHFGISPSNYRKTKSEQN